MPSKGTGWKGWTPGSHRTRRTERQYAARLRRIAQVIAEIVGSFPAGDLSAMPALTAALEHYARAIEPWARSVAGAMIADANQKDLAAWADLAAEMRRGLIEEIRHAPTGAALRQLLDDQVDLITSLPREAGVRVHKLASDALADGRRAGEVAAEIARTYDVTASRANTIARTEVSRASMTLTQARAEYVGSVRYIWKTSQDADVRPSHKALHDTVQLWAEPPVCDPPGRRAHPGCIFNCRCYAWPLLADE